MNDDVGYRYKLELIYLPYHTMKLRNTKFGRFRKVNKAFPPPKRMRDKTTRRKRSFLMYIHIVVFTINYTTDYNIHHRNCSKEILTI